MYKFLLLLSVVLTSCGPSLEEIKLLEVKNNSKGLFFPKPFVICQPHDTNSEDVIASHIQSSFDELIGNEFTIMKFDFNDYSQYLKYGRNLSFLISDLERKDFSQISVSDEIKKVCSASPYDLCILTFVFATPKSKSQIAGSILLSSIVTVNHFLPVEFAQISIPSTASSKMHVIIYSKSEDKVLCYEDEEDKDNPLQKDFTKEQFETLLNPFLQAGKE